MYCHFITYSYKLLVHDSSDFVMESEITHTKGEMKL